MTKIDLKFLQGVGHAADRLVVCSRKNKKGKNTNLCVLVERTVATTS